MAHVKGTNKPNLLFLLSDHQAYYRHGWDQGPHVARPCFDRLAAGGTTFERAYTSCPLCGPARRSMLTGCYPHTHGEVKNDSNHPFDRAVYLDVLAAGGYRNYYYGKWHAGLGVAQEHGCAGFCYPSYNNPYTKPEYQDYLRRKGLTNPTIRIEHSFLDPARSNHACVEGMHGYTQNGRWCNEHASGILQGDSRAHEAFFLADLACERLRQLAESGGDEPFALRVDFWGPHQPYFPSQEYADLYNPSDIPEYPSFSEDVYHAGKPVCYQSEGNAGISQDGKLIFPNPLPWPVWQEVLARAYAQITLIDAAGGLILDALEQYGLAQNTLVIWTTDHGDGIACHGGHFDKRSYMPEEMIRVPLALRYPGKVPAGVRSHALVSNMDVGPTLLDAAGLAYPNPVQARSLLDATGGGQRPFLVVETHGHMERHMGRAVIGRRYKYVYNAGQSEELYDLAADPYELHNLADLSDHAALRDAMRERLEQHARETEDPMLLYERTLPASTRTAAHARTSETKQP